MLLNIKSKMNGWFISLLLLLVRHSHCTRTIFVDPSGNCKDNTTCLEGSSKYCCSTLGYVLEHGILTGTVVKLSNSTHYLDKPFKLWNITNLEIKASSGAAAVNCLDKYAGLNFIFAEDVEISNVTIERCGTFNPSTTAGFKKDGFRGPFNVSEAVRFGFSKNIRITDSKFLNNHGVAVAFYDTIGTVISRNNVFQNNTNDNKQTPLFISGGGLFIEFTYCGILDPVNCSYQYLQDAFNKGSEYIISDCTFTSNYAEHRYDEVASEDSYEREHVSFGKGGGVALILLANATNNTFTVEHCSFSQNKAHWGGAILNTIRHNASHNVFKFNNISFYNNNATFGGGGIRLHSFKFDSIDEEPSSGNTVYYERLRFYGNSAIWGGGLSIAGTTRLVYIKSEMSRDVTVKDCVFDNNTATVGSGVGLATWNTNSDSTGPGMSYKVIFENTMFINNRFQHTEDGQVIGQGALYTDEVAIVFNGINNFTGNDHTAMVLESNSVTFQQHSKTIFQNNTGLEGGAIAMYGKSWLTLMKNSTIVFRHNEAFTKGGAIYNSYPGPPRAAFVTTQLQSTACFLRYEDNNVYVPTAQWNVSIFFIENNAPSFTGNSIYASTLQFCRRYDDTRNNTNAFEWNFTHYQSIDPSQQEIATDAVKIEVGTNWDVVPGRSFGIDIRMTDEKGHDVYGTVKLNIDSDNKSKPVVLDPPNSIFLIQNDTTQLRLLAEQKVGFHFNLSTISGQMISTDRYHSQVKDCLIGFKPVNTTCVCMNNDISDIVQCYPNGDVFLIKGKWAKKNPKGLIQTYKCPSGYCTCHALNGNSDFVCRLEENNQCAHNRKGILCSQCMDGKSVLLGSENCRECDNRSLLIIIPMMLGVLVFVFVIFYFNVNVFSGYLNCFLYSYQMIPLMLPENVQLDTFISIVIGVTGLSGTGGKYGFCVFNGMNNLQKTGINYVVPSSMLLFTILFGICIPSKIWQRYFCCKQSNETDNDARTKSFGSALSFVLVYSYSMFTKVTIELLSSVEIDGESRMYTAAFVRMFDEQHIWYGVLAIFILVFIVVLLPLILLFTPFFASRSQLILRFAPVLNALKDCFKDNATCRSFAAFYFFCRLLLLTMISEDEFQQYILMLLFNILFLTLFTSIQPYKEKSCNFWDTVLLCNLCVVSSLGLVLSVPLSASQKIINVYKVVLEIAVYVPLLTVIFRLIAYLIRKWNVKFGTQKDTDSPVLCPQRKNGAISSRIRRWRTRRKHKMLIPERVVEDFESDYVELDQ